LAVEEQKKHDKKKKKDASIADDSASFIQGAPGKNKKNLKNM